MRELRLGRGWKLSDAASRLGKHWSLISKHERGEVTPTPQRVMDYGKLYGLSYQRMQRWLREGER